MREFADKQIYQTTVFPGSLDRQKLEVYRQMKSHGYRLTNQRRLIIDVILEKECSCCKDIFYEVIKRDNTVGVATVYRMIKSLEEIGAINRKQMYQICFDTRCDKAGAAMVTFSDGTSVELSAREWSTIVQSGLEKMGYDKPVREIEVGRCDRCAY